MAGWVLCFLPCLLFLMIGLCSADHATDQPQESELMSRVKASIPNFFNVMPNLGKIMQEFENDVLNPNPNPRSPFQEVGNKKTIVPHIRHVRDNYKTLREFVQSAMNLGRRGLNTDGLFSLDLRSNSPNRNFDLSSIFGRMSMDSQSKEKADGVTEVPEDTEATTVADGVSTEVPLNEYLNDLLKEQAKGVNDFVLSIFGPRDEQMLSVQSRDKETSVDVSAPVKVSVNSKAEDINRYGDMANDGVLEDADVTLDPESEYLHHVEELHRRQLMLRGYDTDAEDWDEFSPSQRRTNLILEALRSNLKTRDRKKSQYRDPVKRMTEYYYNLNTGKYPKESDNDVYEDYIEDVEKVTGSLDENSKAKLKMAFKQFKDSVERIDFGDNVDISKLEEPEDYHAWMSGRIIDQRDLEIAFLNIDKNDEPNLGDKMVLAFTLTGVPLKIFMDSDVESPIRYLHRKLTEAGVTLNIPVSSFHDMDPVGNEVLYVGAGNNANYPTRAMSIIIPKTDKISSYVSRFSKATSRFPQDVGKENSAKVLNEALKESLTSENDSPFSDVLARSLKENPDKVLADIVDFSRKSAMSSSMEDFFDE